MSLPMLKTPSNDRDCVNLIAHAVRVDDSVAVVLQLITGAR
jgi:hypothetical protein